MIGDKCFVCQQVVDDIDDYTPHIILENFANVNIRDKIRICHDCFKKNAPTDLFNALVPDKSVKEEKIEIDAEKKDGVEAYYDHLRYLKQITDDLSVIKDIQILKDLKIDKK